MPGLLLSPSKPPLRWGTLFLRAGAPCLSWKERWPRRGRRGHIVTFRTARRACSRPHEKPVILSEVALPGSRQNAVSAGPPGFCRFLRARISALTFSRWGCYNTSCLYGPVAQLGCPPAGGYARANRRNAAALTRVLSGTRTTKRQGPMIEQSLISYGPVAQLGERSVRIREVESSSLFRSTILAR